MSSSKERIEESGVIRLSEKSWIEARRRAEIIAPLAGNQTVSTVVAQEAAGRLGCSTRTVYSFLRAWREGGGSILSLAPRSSDGGRGGARIRREVELIIASSIEDTYLTRQKPSVSVLMRTIKERCRKLNLNPPSINTLRSRVNRLSPDYVLVKRQGERFSRRLKPLEGYVPQTQAILEVVQIDHTSVDIIVVDFHSRQPIGRPWITVAIDVYSRCIVGFCLTFEPPSAVSVGLCLTHMVTDKRPWLERIGLEEQWPMSGKPKTIYVDNGKEFHSEALRRGCETHGIAIAYRPIGTPHYGGIVERVIGTLMKMVHELPGTTFSNVTERGSYNSDKKASLTLSELEKWFILAISYYHSSFHSGIKESPAACWERSINEGQELFRVANAKAFLVDFLPIVRRRIQRQGFVIDHIYYMSPALKLWISEKGHHHTFLIRRDPRDLSRIYVLHPQETHYIEVPYRTYSNPAATLWEHRLAMRRLHEEGKKLIDEEAIFKTIETMREIAQNAAHKTKSARRSVERLRHTESISSANPRYFPLPAAESSSSSANSKPIKPFDDIEEW